MSMYYEVYITNYDTSDNPTRELMCSSEINEGILEMKIEKEINKSGTCSFTILPVHLLWDSFYRMKTQIDVYLRGKNVFRGRCTKISMDVYKQKKIECEGALGWFVDSYEPKDDKENIKTQFVYPELLYDQLKDNHNHQLESHKTFYIGTREPTCYAGRLYPSSAMLKGYMYDISDGVTLVADQTRVTETEYIEFDKEMRYVIFDTFSENEDNNPSSTLTDPAKYYYLFDENKTFIETVRINCLSGQTLDDIGKSSSFIDSIKFFRASSGVAGGGSSQSVTYNGIFWITYYDPETEGKDAAGKDDIGWDGGQTSDFLTDWIVDNQHSLMRARVAYPGDDIFSSGSSNAGSGGGVGGLSDVLPVQDTYNVIDILHPSRDVPVSTVEFSRNALDFAIESTDDEPYSYVMPLCKGEAYEDGAFKVSDEAEQMFGKIYKSIEFGSKPSTAKEKKKFQDKVNKYIKLYNPTIPQQFQIKALDDGIIMDNDQMSIIEVGDPVHVIYEPDDIDTVLLCLNISLDIFAPENNSYKIGKYVQSDVDFRIEALTESFTKSRKKAKKSSSS